MSVSAVRPIRQCRARAEGERRPRILFVAPVAVDGGVAEVLAGLFRRAVEGGYEPNVAFLRDGPVVDRFSEHSPKVLEADRLRNPRAFLRTVLHLNGIIHRLRPDVVIAMEPSGHLYTVGPAWRHHVPAVWMVHGLPDRDSRLDRLVGRVPSPAVVVNSRFVMERARSLTSAPLYLLHPGIDVARMAAGDGEAIRARFGIPAHAPLVGIVGRLQAWKGQDLFLDAAALIAAECSDAHFVVVGGTNMGWEDQTYPSELVALAERHGIAERVTFTGHSTEVADWLAAMDVAVSASENEPYGLVICEAMAAGRALVSVNQGGPLELVDDERTGLLSTRDAPSIAAHVLRLLSDESLRLRLGAAGRQQALDHLSDVTMARGLGTLLSTVMPPSRRSQAGRRRPRVLFIAPVSVQGGANEVLLALTSADSAYESLVVALRPGPLVDRLASEEIPHVLLHAPRLLAIRDSLRVMRQLERIVARWEPDLVFSSEAAAHIYAALPAARHRVPAVWRQPARPDARDPINIVVNRLPAKAVAVASDFIAAEQRRFGSRPVAIVRPGINLERLVGADGSQLREDHDILSNAVLVTIVGRLQPWKGQHLFLEAAAAVANGHPTACFAIVGGAEMGWEQGDYPADLRRMAAKLDIGDRVRFTGQTDRVAEWYAASDIVVSASDHEPFGLVVCEAMLMGCAVIACDEGGPREIVEHERTGLLVPRNRGALAAAMDRLLRSPVERGRLGAAARDTALSDFTSARMVRDFEALLEEYARC
jgi:glycosyltransferase involved in cell wall biosynthesis